MFWNRTRKQAQRRALCIKISEVIFKSAFMYRLFHEDLSSIITKNTAILNHPYALYIQLFERAGQGLRKPQSNFIISIRVLHIKACSLSST